MKVRAKAVARPRVDHRIVWLLAALTIVALAAFTYFSQAKASVSYTVDFTDWVTVSNGDAASVTTAMTLANNIRELSVGLAYYDPDQNASKPDTLVWVTPNGLYKAVLATA